MCFKQPKPPKPQVPEPDPELEAQKQAAKDSAQARRAEDKQRSLQLEIARLTGQYGLRSLISAGNTPGGLGFIAGTGSRAAIGSAGSSGTITRSGGGINLGGAALRPRRNG